MLVYTKLIANALRVTVEKLTDPVSSSKCRSVVGGFVVQGETISKCCGTSSQGKECQILKEKLLLFELRATAI
jgi:hypothetical protein